MPQIRLRTFTTFLILTLLLPLIAACGGEPQVIDRPPDLPTAIIAPTSGTSPTSAATSTPATDPTPGEQPTTAPEQPVQPTAVPGDLTFPLKTPRLEHGIVSHLYYTDRERVLTLTTIAGYEWVRQQIQWKDIEGPTPGNYAWGELDNIVNDTAAHNIKLLISIVKAPSFYNPTHGLPQDPKTIGNFVEAMARRYGNKIGAYEIWNEQNLAIENGGRVTTEDAGRYVEILAESYRRIKAVTPEAYILAGAPSSTGYEDPAVAVPDEKYYRAMYSYKDGMIKQYFDAQAVHPGGAANPPDTLYPENPSNVPNWSNDETHYFRHIENVRRFMEEEGVGDHQLWITEFGWATENDTPGYEFGNLISFDLQAKYIIDAMKLVYDNYRYPDGSSWVGVMFLWNMNFAVLKGAEGQPKHEQASFGILNPDWSPRPSFIAIQGYLAELKRQRGE